MTKAIFVRELGDADVLRLDDHDPGAPGPGHVRVRVEAAGVNFIDVYFRTGLYPRPLPYVAGLEGAGTVEAVGPDVDGLAVGDAVAWAGVPSSYAEIVVAPAERVVRVRGKGRKERLVPFGRPAARALEAYLPTRREWRRGSSDDDEPLFVNQRGGRLSDRSVRRRDAVRAAQPVAVEAGA